MQNSEKYMKENGGNFITFQENIPVTVKLIADKEVEIKDQFKGGTLQGLRYLVELNGEQTTFQTAGVTLISKLALCNPGDVVTITKVKVGMKTSYKVDKEGAAVTTGHESDEELNAGTGDAPSW